jgi:hypothetical protein
MIKVDSRIEVVEVRGEKVPIGQSVYLHVGSHGNMDTWAVLTFEGVSVTVTENDLRAALSNAVNINRFGR